MDFFSEDTGCWTEDTLTGRKAWLSGTESVGASLHDARENNRIWTLVDMFPQRSWQSRPHELFLGCQVCVTLFIDTHADKVYVLVPSILGSTRCVTRSCLPDSAVYDRLCFQAAEGLCESTVRDFFNTLKHVGGASCNELCQVALSSLPKSHLETDYTAILHLTGC